MAKTIIKEIADNKRLQAYVNESQARFAPVFWPSLLTVKNEDSLRFDTIIGDRKSGVAGNVTAYNVSAPLHGRDALREKGGKIPSIRGKRVMNETDLMTYITLQRQTNPDFKRVLDLIFDDIAFASVAPHKRVDWMISKLLSSGGKLSFTDTDNVGVVTQYDIDFGVPAEHKTGTVGNIWSDTENSTPFKDLQERFFKPIASMGLSGGVIRMHPTAIFNMLDSKSVIAKFGGDSIDTSLEKVNSFLKGNNFPIIRAFNASIGIEQDGKVAYSNPWEESNAVWTPDGAVGQLHMAPVVERERPVDGVTYAEYMGNLVKKFGETDPVVEFTGYEMNAFPSLDVADQMLIMNTAKKTNFA